MNLHQIASGAIGNVNPFINAVVRVYAGETETPSGRVEPTYTDVSVGGQLQPLSWRDLQHLDGLNITGVEKKFYVNGNFSAVNRPGRSGGDLLIIGEQVWMIPTVIELWPDWCSLALRLQEG